MSKFTFDPVAFGQDIARLRENGVAVANKSDDVARHALGGLRAGAVTLSAITIAALAAHGNPKTPKGKAVDSINGLRYAKGGEAARNCFRAVFDIAENVAVYGEGVPAIGEAIDAFVNRDSDAAKGLFGLRDAVRSLVKAKLQADDPDSADREANAEADAVPPAPVVSVADTVAAMTAYIDGLSVDDISANQDAIMGLMTAIEGAAGRIATPLQQAA